VTRTLACAAFLSLTLLVSSAAWATSFVVESPAYATRVEAEAHLQRVLVETGDARARVVRRFIRGDGWRYLVALEGVASAEEAIALQPRFGAGTAVGTVWSLDAEGRERVGPPGTPAATSTPPVPPPAGPSPALAPPNLAGPKIAPILEPSGPVGSTPAPATTPDRRELRRVQKATELLLMAAVEAHGGPEGGRAVLDASPALQFAYRRSLPVSGGELVAHHDFVRQGDGMAVRIRVIKGEGVSSRILLASSGRAWVETSEGPVARDPARTREVLARFSPSDLLAIPLGFAADLAGASAWRGLVAGGVTADGAVLRHPAGVDDAPDGLVEAVFHPTDHHLVRVQWREDEAITTLMYGGYSVVAPGLVLPFRVQVHVDGRLVESLEIESLTLLSKLPAAALAEPG
jgi:hypothetical protein